MNSLPYQTSEENKQLDALHRAYTAAAAHAERLDELGLTSKGAWKLSDQRWAAYQNAQAAIRSRVETAQAEEAARLTRPIITRQKSAELLITATAPDYSRKYQAALLQMRRDVDDGRRPAPQPDAVQPY